MVLENIIDSEHQKKSVILQRGYRDLQGWRVKYRIVFYTGGFPNAWWILINYLCGIIQ